MKKKMFVLAFGAVLTSVSALADDAMVDGIDPSTVVQSVRFNPQSGINAEAGIIRNDDAEASLVIVHQKGVRNYLIIDNSKLGLTIDGMAGTESSLAVAGNNSLLVQTQNETVGRHRFSRTLTVALRDGKYVVAGFTYTSRDTLDLKSGESCDYNLLTGKGQRDGRPVQISSKAPDLSSLEDTEKMHSCNGW